MTTNGFVHRYVPGTSGRTLLLLHGTGGNEQSLLGLGRDLDPAAALLSPRGRVMEGPMPRFFRRLREGVFDLEDLALRTRELGAFVRAAAGQYGLDPAQVTAVGFSNGANIAASLLLAEPGVLAGAVLLRAMVPFEPERPAGLDGTPVWLGAGRHDPIVPLDNARHLAELLRQAGAKVTLDLREAGHNLLPAEVDAVREWLGQN